jgi:hypothetical protein
MIRPVLIAAGVIAPFFFPWKFSLLLAFALSLALPFGGIATGLVADALYYSPGLGLPWATIAAAVGALIAYGVRRFAKARIIGA